MRGGGRGGGGGERRSVKNSGSRRPRENLPRGTGGREVSGQEGGCGTAPVAPPPPQRDTLGASNHGGRARAAPPRRSAPTQRAVGSTATRRLTWPRRRHARAKVRRMTRGQLDRGGQRGQRVRLMLASGGSAAPGVTLAWRAGRAKGGRLVLLLGRAGARWSAATVVRPVISARQRRKWWPGRLSRPSWRPSAGCASLQTGLGRVQAGTSNLPVDAGHERERVGWRSLQEASSETDRQAVVSCAYSRKPAAVHN